MVQFERSLSDAMLQQVPFAASRALNDVAQGMVGGRANGRGRLALEMQRVFEDPKPFTLRGFRFNRATKRNLATEVLPKDVIGRRHYLYTQAEGGVRPQTGLERLLSARLSYAGQILAVTPARGLRLDRYGNMSRGELNQIVSAIQAQRDPLANTTAASRRRNSGRAQYFVPRPGSRLSPGVWKRTRRGLVKVLHFTASMPRYRKRLDVEAIGNRYARAVFPERFSQRLREAWATRKR